MYVRLDAEFKDDVRNYIAATILRCEFASRQISVLYFRPKFNVLGVRIQNAVRHLSYWIVLHWCFTN